MPPLLPLILGAIAALAPLALPAPGRAQALVDIERLRLATPADCAAIKGALADKASGGQWLVGSGIALLGQPNARQSMRRLDGAFERVSCYQQTRVGDQDMVFVANAAFSTCGWVRRADLLDEHAPRSSDGAAAPRAVCEPPRAMLLDGFCRKLTGLGGNQFAAACAGVPPGLRAKGVLTGSTTGQQSRLAPFMTAPVGGAQRDIKSFFSVLEIHDIDREPGGSLMALMGDGDGDLFGWLTLDALKLWPTRLGLFYGLDGLGRLFQTRGTLIRNWRTGQPAPDVVFEGDAAGLQRHIHGPLPLVSYPIVRTIDERTDPSYAASDTPFHEVVFLGKTGPGAAAQLLRQAELTEALNRVRRLNVLLVVDTTESMQPYLPLIQRGITDFIEGYWRGRQDPSTRLPELRIGVVAYADFRDARREGLDDPIKTEELVPPLRVEPGLDPRAQLARISAHRGLSDDVGEYREAAIEAVAQLSATFKSDRWFEDAPRLILHIADHGSRATANPAAVLARLDANRVYYAPIAVITDDQGDRGRAEARDAFLGQASVLMRRVFTDASPRGVPRVELTDRERATPAAVRDLLDAVLSQVAGALKSVRDQIVRGATPPPPPSPPPETAISKMRLSDQLRRDYGLDALADQLIVEAGTGFAPMQLRAQGLARPIDWTYTVALEPSQLTLLARSFNGLCAAAGRPEQRRTFRQAIVALAQSFSGDTMRSEEELRAVLDDLGKLRGADRSFLATPVQVLLQRIDSTDPAVIDGIRRDVCWTSYHLANARAELYVDPARVSWTGREFVPDPGAAVIKRSYVYRPPIGAPVVYLPAAFFVLPSAPADDPRRKPCGFFDTDCAQ